MAGKFVGIGVGPGDPDLITVKAIKAIEAADVLVCPEARNGKGSFAFEIAESYIPKETEILTLEFPMVHDHDVMMKAWKENAEVISERVAKGQNVAFLTLGDPGVYSTYMYLLPLLEEGVKVETIPGITSFCAVAANQNLPLALWEETFGIVPLKHGCETAELALEHYDNVVIMKPSHDSERLAEILEEKGLDDKFVMISKCSTDIQQVTTDIDVLKAGNVPYLSTMIVKRKGF